MRASVWARAIPVVVALALAACGGGSGPAGAGGGPGGSGARGGLGGAGGAAGAAGGGTGGSTAGASGSTAGLGGHAGSAGTGAGTAGAAGSASGGAGGTAGGVGGSAAGTGGAAAGSGGSTAGAGGSAAGAGGSTAGHGGAAGTAGRGGGGAAGASPFMLLYASTSATALAFNIKLTVMGPSTPNVSAIKLRYYFTDDSGNGTVNPAIDLAKWTIASTGTSIDLRNTGGCAVTFSTRKLPETSYADFGCGLSSPVAAGDVLTFTLHFDPAQNPANDYSFIDSAGVLVANDHILVMVNGLVVGGTAAP